jgi:hypothetical protein
VAGKAGSGLYLAVAGDMRTRIRKESIYAGRMKNTGHTRAREAVQAVHLYQSSLLIRIVREPISIISNLWLDGSNSGNLTKP